MKDSSRHPVFVLISGSYHPTFRLPESSQYELVPMAVYELSKNSAWRTAEAILLNIKEMGVVEAELRKADIPWIVLAPVYVPAEAVAAYQAGAMAYLIESELRSDLLEDMVSVCSSRKAERAQLKSAAVEGQEKSRFLSYMSHEIRTPLNGVLGLTSLLRRGRLNEKQTEYVRLIENTGQVLLTIVNDVLNFSKLDAKKVQLDKTEFSLASTIEETLELFGRMAGEKGLELVSHMEANVPNQLIGDPARLRQILFNLVGNSVKFTKSGEVLIRVSMLSKEPLKLRFEVVDTGIGISNQEQQQLFQLYAQASHTTEKKFGGTGLGLAICKGLVEMMGGEIGVLSETGKGSTFWFTASFDRNNNSRGKATHSSLLGRRALILVDNENTSKSLADTLSAWGMHVQKATSQEEALRRVKESSESGKAIELILVDLQLSGSDDGMDFGKVIKVNPKTAGIHLILLYSHHPKLRGALTLAEQIGFSACMGKPVQQMELKTVVERVLDDSKTNRAVAAASAQKRGWVLVVDDDDVSRLVLGDMIRELGFNVEDAMNGAQALQRISSKKYDIIFMDRHMPEMDGYTAARKIREREAGGQHTPIIAQTASVLDCAKQECMDAGIDDYLSKPITFDQVRASLEKWVGKKNQEANEMKDAPLLDKGILAALQKIRKGADEVSLLNKLTRIFSSDTPMILKDLRETIHKSDGKAVKLHAHKLKGSASNIGAISMSELCKQLETSGLDGDSQKAEKLLEALENEFERVKTALDKFIQENG